MSKIPFEEYSRAVIAADASMKQRNGHSFEMMLKTRCQWCARSPKARGRCRGWFNTFVSALAEELTGVYGIPDQPSPPKEPKP